MTSFYTNLCSHIAKINCFILSIFIYLSFLFLNKLTYICVRQLARKCRPHRHKVPDPWWLQWEQCSQRRLRLWYRLDTDAQKCDTTTSPHLTVNNIDKLPPAMSHCHKLQRPTAGQRWRYPSSLHPGQGIPSSLWRRPTTCLLLAGLSWCSEVVTMRASSTLMWSLWLSRTYWLLCRESEWKEDVCGVKLTHAQARSGSFRLVQCSILTFFFLIVLVQCWKVLY